MAAFTVDTLRPRYHDALVAWQKKHFPELRFLEANWMKYFPNRPPFQLFAKVGKLACETIGHGRMAGQPRLQKAGEMVGNMFYSARDIIRAQASSELGAIHQHRLTLDEAPTDAMKMAVLRIMSEELRHGYQMFWVFDHDPTWKKTGHPDIAADTMDELLAFDLGTQPLEAFNIPFVNFLDNIVFATVIDLVGKYALEMQKVFAYAPMARSMGPMLAEEGFHIGSGRSFLRDLAIAATNGSGRYSIDDLQRVLNAWIPRGVEMFGDERGGSTAVTFGFKDRDNRTAQAEYYHEVREVVTNVDIAIVQWRLNGASAADARTIATEIEETREPVRGIAPEELLYVPDLKFFRTRGLEAVAFRPYDVHGELLAVDAEGYLAYLATKLPGHHVRGAEFGRYRAALVGRRSAATKLPL
ncbi:MAG TPA: Phenylacetic acid catabolic protein [Thermoanaerobaculia bacterium]|nr:Phenylacetic acid catabolic protein [Thermoanaerobaculia bacterium]